MCICPLYDCPEFKCRQHIPMRIRIRIRIIIRRPDPDPHQCESRKWIRSTARWKFIMEQWRITSGEVEAHNRAVKAHLGAVEGLLAYVADFYHSNEDPYQHEKSRIRSSWKWKRVHINVCGSATLRVSATANHDHVPFEGLCSPIPINPQNSQLPFLLYRRSFWPMPALADGTWS